MPAMALDDVEEHVGCVGAVREIADFDNEDGRMRVRRERVRELTGAKQRSSVSAAAVVEKASEPF
jgi:hypothetical protein